MLPRKIIFILLAVAYCPCYAINQLTPKDSSTVTIMLQNASDKLSKIDSVFIIFDRYDLRGAGVIKRVFYPDVENKIRVSLPKGKYYINIYCLGIYNKESFDGLFTQSPARIIIFSCVYRLLRYFIREISVFLLIILIPPISPFSILVSS